MSEHSSETLADLFANVRCGVTIGPGWVPIVCWLADEIRKRGAQVTITQCKEKFGNLRVYADGDDIEDLVAVAEFRCSKTCEDCGAPGSRRQPRYWIKTVCDACELEWRKEMGLDVP
jgi:hypothetical protein